MIRNAEYYRGRHAALLQTRAKGWDERLRDCSEQFAPFRARFFLSDKDRGTKRADKIINNAPLEAVRICAAGFMAGISSPSRPWYRLGTPDPDLTEFGPVKYWLWLVEERMRERMHRSNFYNGLFEVYTDLIWAGAPACALEDDLEDVVRAYNFPVGSYCLGTSSRGMVDTVYRETKMTAAQIVERFGRRPGSDEIVWDNISTTVKNAYDTKRYDDGFDVCQVIEPNFDRDGARGDYRGMAYRSCWYEKTGNDGKFLSEGGYNEFPVLAPRWSPTADDVYGNAPVMNCLGDAKGLQVIEKRKLKLIGKLSDPPMKAPSSLEGKRVSTVEGDVTWVDETATQKFEPSQDFGHAGPALTSIAAEIAKHEGRIGRSLYVDLFLMLAESDRRQVTAEEIRAKQEEKMLQLGPVLERLQDELLDPAIDRVFHLMLRRGHLPEPPEELQGQELKVEYISPLAQAQKLLGLASLDRTVVFVRGLAELEALGASVLDKLDVDQAVDEYSQMVGTSPRVIRSDEDVAKIREARAEQEQAMAAAEAAKTAQAGSVAARNLSQTDVAGDNALTRLLGVA